MNTTVIKRRLYLADLEVEATDVYKQVNSSNVDTSGNVKITLPENVDNSGSVKITHNLYNTNNLDTNRYYKETAQLDFSTANFSNAQIEKQNQDIVANASEFLVSNGNSGKIPLKLKPLMKNLLIEVKLFYYVVKLTSACPARVAFCMTCSR